MTEDSGCAEQDIQACLQALEKAHAYLREEITGADAEVIREHLSACQNCMNNFDVEAAITQLVKKCCTGPKAPAHLKASIMQTILVDIENQPTQPEPPNIRGTSSTK